MAVGDPGTITVIDTERIVLLEIVETERDAHTCAWDPIGRHLYVLDPYGSGAVVYAERDESRA